MSADRNEDFAPEGGLTKVRVWLGWPFHAGQLDVILPAELAFETKISPPEQRTIATETGRERAIQEQASSGEAPNEQAESAEEVILLDLERPIEG